MTSGLRNLQYISQYEYLYRFNGSSKRPRSLRHNTLVNCLVFLLITVYLGIYLLQITSYLNYIYNNLIILSIRGDLETPVATF